MPVSMISVDSALVRNDWVFIYLSDVRLSIVGISRSIRLTPSRSVEKKGSSKKILSVIAFNNRRYPKREPASEPVLVILKLVFGEGFDRWEEIKREGCGIPNVTVSR